MREALPPLGRSHEVSLVDDGSRGGTGRLVHEIARRDPNFKATRLRRNFGQTAAIMAGIDHAASGVIIPMDGDLRNDPKDIGSLPDKSAESYDPVSSRRRNPGTPSSVPFSGGSPTSRSRGSAASVSDYGYALKACRRDVTEGVPLYGGTHRFVPICAARQGGRIAELEAPHRPRRTGR